MSVGQRIIIDGVAYVREDSVSITTRCDLEGHWWAEMTRGRGFVHWERCQRLPCNATRMRKGSP